MLSPLTRAQQPAQLQVSPLADHQPDFPRIVAEVRAEALVANYHAIARQVPTLGILPMVKANAYGHDVGWVAGQLLGLPRLDGFGVATLEEGAELRAAMGPRGIGVAIFVFSGCAPWSEDKGNYCERHSLIPVIATDADWDRFTRGGWAAKLRYEIKFNTGMNRLGLSPAKAIEVSRWLSTKPADLAPIGILSHLACGESPRDPLSRRQLEVFKDLRSLLSASAHNPKFHLANSSAIWKQREWKLDGISDRVRPGLALYGVAPWAKAPSRGLSAVMSLRAQIVAIHALQPGERVGYGGEFRVKSGRKVLAAVLSAGYEDGLHRSLARKGIAFINGRKEHFVGRISMDLSTISCGSRARVGDWAEILGPGIDIWEQARAAETIPYELLTSVAKRVQRKYV